MPQMSDTDQAHFEERELYISAVKARGWPPKDGQKQKLEVMWGLWTSSKTKKAYKQIFGRL